jgi:hypothetical protein
VEIDELVVRKLRVTEDLSTPERSATLRHPLSEASRGLFRRCSGTGSSAGCTGGRSGGLFEMLMSDVRSCRCCINSSTPYPAPAPPGSTKMAAPAVGEGGMAVRFVAEHLGRSLQPGRIESSSVAKAVSAVSQRLVVCQQTG